MLDQDVGAVAQVVDGSPRITARLRLSAPFGISAQKNRAHGRGDRNDGDISV